MITSPQTTGELGLTLAQQLLAVEDLHYGYWDNGLALTLHNLPIAQQRYNEVLLAELPTENRPIRVLDVGCGTGHLLHQLLQRGYLADGVIPAAQLRLAVQTRLASWEGYQPTLFPCTLEAFPVQDHEQHYDVVMFSESFQYIPVAHSLKAAAKILKPGGLLLICDFFKTSAHGDGEPGDKSFGGGHPLQRFYEQIAQSPFELQSDRDITPFFSPNLELLNDLLLNRIHPAVLTIGSYLRRRYPFSSWIGNKLFRRQWTKLEYKYFSGYRSKAVFERYKSYRLLTYRLR